MQESMQGAFCFVWKHDKGSHNFRKRRLLAPVEQFNKSSWILTAIDELVQNSEQLSLGRKACNSGFRAHVQLLNLGAAWLLSTGVWRLACSDQAHQFVQLSGLFHQLDTEHLELMGRRLVRTLPSKADTALGLLAQV
jgi:hypothetical protein